MNKIKEHFFAFLRQMKNIHSNDIFLIEYELRLHFFQQFLYMTIFEVLLTAISCVLKAMFLFLLGTLLFMGFTGFLGYRILHCLLGKVYAIEGICYQSSKKHSYIIIQVNDQYYVKIFLNPYALRFHPKNGNLIRIYGETEHLKKVTSDLYELSPCYFAYIKQNYASEKQSVRQEDNSENRFISD
jgi:hypothetical protein